MEELRNYLENWANDRDINQPDNIEIHKSYSIEEDHIELVWTMATEVKSYTLCYVLAVKATIDYIESIIKHIEEIKLPQIYNEHINPNNNERNN